VPHSACLISVAHVGDSTERGAAHLLLTPKNHSLADRAIGGDGRVGSSSPPTEGSFAP